MHHLVQAIPQHIIEPLFLALQPLSKLGDTIKNLYKMTTIAMLASLALTACSSGGTTSVANEQKVEPVETTSAQATATTDAQPKPPSGTNNFPAMLNSNFVGQWDCSGGEYYYLKIRGTAVLKVDGGLSWEAQWEDSEAHAVWDNPKNTKTTGRMISNGTQMSLIFETMTRDGKERAMDDPTAIFSNLTQILPEKKIKITMTTEEDPSTSESYMFEATPDAFSIGEGGGNPITCTRV